MPSTYKTKLSEALTDLDATSEALIQERTEKKKWMTALLAAYDATRVAYFRAKTYEETPGMIFTVKTELLESARAGKCDPEGLMQAMVLMVAHLVRLGNSLYQEKGEVKIQATRVDRLMIRSEVALRGTIPSPLYRSLDLLEEALKGLDTGKESIDEKVSKAQLDEASRASEELYEVAEILSEEQGLKAAGSVETRLEKPKGSLTAKKKERKK